MSASNEKSRTQKPIPRWLIFVAVVVTAGTTVWAMAQTNMRGPQASWDQAQGAVDQVWGDPAMAQGGVAPQGAAIPGAAMPGAMAADADTAAAGRPVAGLPGVPMIMFGSRRPHADRGPCTMCHGVVTGEGTPVPAIHSFSSMPHGFRGNCTNCHQITIGRGLTGSPVAATMVVPNDGAATWDTGAQPMMAQPMAAQPMMQQPMMQQPMAAQPMMAQPMAAQPMMQQPMMQQPMAARPRNEAEWRGMEVRTGAQGVVVTNAEGTAARSGLQPGDLVTSINGTTVPDVTAFVDATQNGNLPQGTVIVRRGEQRLAFELQPRVNNAMVDNGTAAMAGQMAVN